MRVGCKSIYKNCREDAGFTQDAAAEKLHVSTRSLSDYEGGKTIPGDDVVCKMVEVYQAPKLAYLHLQQNTEIGQQYLPDLSLDEFSKAVLRFQKQSRDMKTIEPELIDIACDGVVDRQELPVWEKAREELRSLAGAALAVLLVRKEESPLLKQAR